MKDQRQRTILIIEPNKLLAFGLQVALRQASSSWSVQICANLLEQAALRQHITFVAPDIVIANPLLTGLHFQQDLIGTEKILLVAINHAYLPDEYYEGYNLVIPPSIDPVDLFHRVNDLDRVEVRPIEEENQKQQLSQRECEVVTWVARGLTNREIADQLNLSPHTVVTHRRNIASKLDIHSPSGLTVYALMNNLISMDEAKGL